MRKCLYASSTGLDGEASGPAHGLGIHRHLMATGGGGGGTLGRRQSVASEMMSSLSRRFAAK
jgi:hypothetical protein